MSASALGAQRPELLYGPVPTSLRTRDSRVVLWSPHFDVVPRLNGGLSCHQKPARYYGFEGPIGRDSTGTVRMRVLRVTYVPESEVELPLQNAVLQLQYRLDDSAWKALPRTDAMQLTDSSGALQLTAWPGIYQVRLSMIGYGVSNAIIQIRKGASDSIRVYLDPAVIC